MDREEKRQKFHEALKHMLFPPPPAPPSPPPHEINIEELLNSNPHDPIAGELEELGTSSSSEDERACGNQKPTRAQRKRVRKKKLKKDSERRNGLIGPLMAAPDGAEGVGGNVAEKLNSENDPLGEVAPCTNQSKVKHRRRAKKLAKGKPESSITEKSQQDCDSVSYIEF